MSLSFDPQTLRNLAALLNETGLSEIELAEGDRKVRLARAIAPVEFPVMAHAAPALAQAAPAAEAKADPAKHPGAVKSPMVGVAYLSPEPGAAPYVATGQKVETGATLLLIEAMKTFNQIKAPKAGTIRQILVTSGQPVEFGEPLVLIE